MKTEPNKDVESFDPLPAAEPQSIRTKNQIVPSVWVRTPLGPMDSWSDCLATAFGMIKNAAQPAWIIWGEQHRLLCNELALRRFGIDEVNSLGQPAAVVLPSIWEVLESKVQGVMQTGEGLHLQDQAFSLQREGVTENTWWDYSLNPILDKEGRIKGVLAFFSERTEQFTRSESRLREALNAANGVVFEHRVPMDDQIYIDRKWAVFLGYHPEDLPSASDLSAWFFDQMHPDDLRLVKDTFKALIERQMEGYLLELRLRHKLGHWVWLQADARTVERNQDGSVCRLIGLMTEISARKKFEQILRQKERRFRIATRAAELGVFYVDYAQGVSQWENEQMYKIFGVDPKDGPLATQDFYETVLHPQDRQLFDQNMKEAMEKRALIQVSVRIRRKFDGQQRWIRIFGQMTDSGQDGSPGLLGVVMDITARKQAELAQEHTLAARTAVMENMADAIAMADPDGRIIYHNPASLELHGYANLTDALLPKSSLAHQWEMRDLDGKSLPLEAWPMVRALGGERFNDYCVRATNLDTAKTFVGSYSGRLVQNEEGAPLFALLTIRDISERIKMEAALENERQLLQAVYDTIPVMLSVYDPQIQKVALNQHFERVTGWTVDETTETNVMELVYPDPEYRQKVTDYMQSLAHGFKDLLMVAKDGRTIESSWANVEIPDGRRVGIGIDITEIKANERKLRHLSERLQFLHEVDEAIITSHSSKGVAQAVVDRIPVLLPDCVRAGVSLFGENSGSEKITTLALYLQEGTGIGKVPEFPEEIPTDHIFRILEQGKPYTVPDLEQVSSPPPLVEALKEDGIRAQVLYPIFIAGRLVGSLNIGLKEPGLPAPEQWDVIGELVTQLAIGLENAQLHERILEMNQQLLETIVSNLPVGVALVQQPGDAIVMANPAYQKMVPGGRAESTHLSEHWTELEFDLAALCRQVAETATPFSVEDARLRDHEEKDSPANGRYCSLWLFPVNLTDMNNRSVLVLAIDTTERKQAELALVEAERLTAIGRMSASLAHEINNPIQSVVGCLGLAMEVLENGQDASQFMDVAMDELIRASQIVKRLRDLGKSHESEKRPADVQESLNRVLLLTRKKAQDQGVTIQWETQESPPDVMMDPDRIAQVFLNLVLNAIESMSEGGDLAVSVHPTDDPEGVRIAFKDTGVGIPPDQLERMFEAFHSTKQMGLGLGLYVSRKIIQDHRGEIWVESEVGQGSTFTVWLPKA